jgi:hypothetical protein
MGIPIGDLVIVENGIGSKEWDSTIWR